ncbi:Decapping nuclease [Aphelenchoides bicaudatus]|nr:Decapping nuclease [Aphelenchoides bicaudatus]
MPPEQFPTISKPGFIGEFSNDHQNNEVQIGRSRLRYLHESALQQRRVYFDLNHGFETFRAKQNDGALDGLLKFIMSISEPGANLQKVIHDCGFVTWRGTLTRIAATPFLNQNSDPWTVACCQFNGVVFLCEITEDKLNKQANENEFAKKASYWGHCFEKFITKDTVDSEPNISEPVSTFVDYSAVFKLAARTQKGDRVEVCLGAEMDAIDSRGNYVELKTQFQKLGIGRFWPEKQMKWWIQSYLVGIERLIVGLRDQAGVVEQLQEVNIQHLRQSRTGWEPAVCMNFMLNYLDTVRSRLKALPEGGILLTDYKSNYSSYKIREVREDEHAKIQFLPNYFIEHFNK